MAIPFNHGCTPTQIEKIAGCTAILQGLIDHIKSKNLYEPVRMIDCAELLERVLATNDELQKMLQQARTELNAISDKIKNHGR